MDKAEARDAERARKRAAKSEAKTAGKMAVNDDENCASEVVAEVEKRMAAEIQGNDDDADADDDTLGSAENDMSIDEDYGEEVKQLIVLLISS